jgi:hypothetical protein
MRAAAIRVISRPFAALGLIMEPTLTVITPTTGKPSLSKLIRSIDSQDIEMGIVHLLLWDNVRDPAAGAPDSYESALRHSIVLPAGTGRNGKAPGSPLRAIGLMAATTPWVTFADDDVWWEPHHLKTLRAGLSELDWCTTLRTIWSPDGTRIGVDRFESVGDDETRRVPYEMVDNNCMLFRREHGTAAAVLYRETRLYNDDRLMYAFLKRNAGKRGRTGTPTINHICPERLIDFCRKNCSPE